MNSRIEEPGRIIRTGKILSFLAVGLVIAGCATTAPKQRQVAVPSSQEIQVAAQKQATAVTVKTLKRKVAIGRFTNETRYGKTFQVDGANDPLGKQASDMLATRLVASQKFLVFERPDLEKLKAEQAILKDSNLIGVDALIMGSVTEFGRSTTGKSGFLSATKIQTARAKVEIRLVDARTGYVFFTTTGTGEANTESGEIAGFGSKADYDGTLNDRAIAAAISDVQNGLINKLEEREWRTDILKIDGQVVYVSGGSRQGLKVGDKLTIMQKGEIVKSSQTGFDISLPGKAVAQIKITSLFGDSESNEGSMAQLVSGVVIDSQKNGLYVSEIKE
ncbi:MAG: CsgG/HfaB family protein [Steroidobacteraceae bacterium]